MRRITVLISLLVVIALVGCGFGINQPGPKPSVSTPTKSGEQMQTEISQMLTVMPTGTGQAASAVTQTPPLPTLIVDTLAPTETAVPAVTETPTVEAPAQGQVAATATATQAAAQPQSAATATATVAAATATQAPTSGPTATPSAGDPRSWLGSPDATDNMDNPDTWIWPTGSDDFTLASFRNGKQTVQALTTKDGWRLANPTGADFSSLYLETTFKVGDCRSDVAPMADHYGVIVRVPYLDEPFQGYLFGFNCNGQYSLRAWDWNGMDSRRQDMQMLIDWTPAVKDGKNIINAGVNTTNVMGIMTIGSKIRLYANGKFLAEYDYSTNSKIPHNAAGFFGVFVGSRDDTKFTVAVDQMSYWKNPHP